MEERNGSQFENIFGSGGSKEALILREWIECGRLVAMGLHSGLALSRRRAAARLAVHRLPPEYAPPRGSGDNP